MHTSTPIRPTFSSPFSSLNVYTHQKKNWLFVKDFARRMKLNWQYNRKKMLRILFFTWYSQFMSISNRNIWFSLQRVRFSRFVTKKWEKNKFVFQNFIFVFDVIVHLYLSYFVRSFVRFVRPLSVVVVVCFSALILTTN